MSVCSQSPLHMYCDTDCYWIPKGSWIGSDIFRLNRSFVHPIMFPSRLRFRDFLPRRRSDVLLHWILLKRWWDGNELLTAASCLDHSAEPVQNQESRTIQENPGQSRKTSRTPGGAMNPCWLSPAASLWPRDAAGVNGWKCSEMCGWHLF